METLNKLVGKVIQIRSPLYCQNTKICNKCIGDLPYILGVENIGLTASSIGSHYLNYQMKSFHDASIKVSEVNLETMIVE